jgi:hypothetical protein
MAKATGRCGNIDYCSLADARQPVQPYPGMEGVCPECASALLPPPGKAPGILRPALAGIGFICVTGGMLYAGLSGLYPAHANSMAGGGRPDVTGAYSHRAGVLAPSLAPPAANTARLTR